VLLLLLLLFFFCVHPIWPCGVIFCQFNFIERIYGLLQQHKFVTVWPRTRDLSFLFFETAKNEQHSNKWTVLNYSPTIILYAMDGNKTNSSAGRRVRKIQSISI
jgi:hypothetical protein